MFEWEFIDEQIEDHGKDYVEDLIAKGFIPVLTDKGWCWLQQPRSIDRSEIDYLVSQD